MKKYKIINKKRFYVFLTLSFLIIISIITLFKPSNQAYSNTLEESFIEVVVAQGDTLWNISIEYIPKGYDIRKMIYKIKGLNEMETSYIFPGDIIKIPLIE